MAILVRDKNTFTNHLHDEKLYNFIHLEKGEYETGLLTKVDEKLIVDVDKVKPKFVHINFNAYNEVFGIEKVEFIGTKDYIHFKQSHFSGRTYISKPTSFINKDNNYIKISYMDNVKEISGKIRLDLNTTGSIGMNPKYKKITIGNTQRIIDSSNEYKRIMEYPQYCLYDGVGYYPGNILPSLTEYPVNDNSNEFLYDILVEDLVYSFKFINKEVFFIKNPKGNKYLISNDRKEKFIDWKLDKPIKMKDGSLLNIKTE